MAAEPDPSAVLVDGPWIHRDVTANGCRFHVAELGDGPLVLLLHGFPEFWWSWREQLVGLADAGYRAVAVDLRGYGASDKPPRGYDGYTLAADIAGLIRVLGESDAMIVGHDWGGSIGWTVAALHPAVVRRLVIIASAHPLRMRAALLTNAGGQRSASPHLLHFQVPRRAEHDLLDDDAAKVGMLLHAWGGPGFPPPDVETRCREAMRIPLAGHSALEYFRWVVRAPLRPSGRRYFRLLAKPVAVPTLQLHGALDPVTLPATALGSGRYVHGDYEWRLLPGLGHFPHEEAAELVTAEIVRWGKA